MGPNTFQWYTDGSINCFEIAYRNLTSWRQKHNTVTLGFEQRKSRRSRKSWTKNALNTAWDLQLYQMEYTYRAGQEQAKKDSNKILDWANT